MATETITESAWELTDFNAQHGSSSQSVKPVGVTEFQKDIGTNSGEATPIELPLPTTAVNTLQRWNSPRINIYRVAAIFYSFFVMGLSDAAYGPLIPYLEKYYDLSYTVVSLIFLSPFAGYTIAAFLNNVVHMHFGQRGLGLMAPTCHLIPFIVMSFHPPYPVLIVLYVFVGFGNGLIDAGWNAWTGAMASANRIQGLQHGIYALGGTISPLIATTMIAKHNLPWYNYYYLLASVAALELVTSGWAFWLQTAAKHREETARLSDDQSGRTREALKNRVTWILMLYFFAYVGAEITLGGWIVTFMLQVRSASPYVSGVSATGFWIGMTVGRMGLGFVTEYFGERICVCVYLACALAVELIFWLVPKFIVSAIAVSFLGLFFGPLFPAGVVMATKLLPPHLHVSAIGFATALGGTGAAIFPFITGAIAQSKGVKVLQPIILALLAVVTIMWLILPRIKKQALE